MCCVHELEEEEPGSEEKGEKCRVACALSHDELVREHREDAHFPLPAMIQLLIRVTLSTQWGRVWGEERVGGGGVAMVVNLIDKTKQWYNASRPITFPFV